MSRRQSKATKQAAMVAAERAAAIRAEQARTERRTRALVVGSVVVAMLLVVAVLGYLLSRSDTTGQATEPPRGVVDGYSVPLGPGTAPVSVTVYEDFMCPYCGLFEQISSEPLREYVDRGDVQVRYHVVSFLDKASTDDYSTRAANALFVVLDTAGPEVAVDFHDALFDNQPQEGGAGLTDDRMVDLAVQAGADEDAIRGPIQDLEFEQFVINATGEWSERGFTGTPAVAVNGQKVDFTDAESLLANTEQAIQEALASE